MVQKLKFTYNEEEFAWETRKLLLYDKMKVNIVLKKAGHVLITQKDEESGEFPTIMVNEEPDTEFELILHPHHVEHPTIQIFVCQEIDSATYEYIK